MHFLNNAFSVVLLYYGDKLPEISGESFNDTIIAVMIVIAVICIPAGVLLLYNKKNIVNE